MLRPMRRADAIERFGEDLLAHVATCRRRLYRTDEWLRKAAGE
jgi:hypothetical protein